MGAPQRPQGAPSQPPMGGGQPQPQGGAGKANPQALADLAQVMTPERFKLFLQLMGAAMADAYSKLQQAGRAPAQPPMGGGQPPPGGPPGAGGGMPPPGGAPARPPMM